MDSRYFTLVDTVRDVCSRYDIPELESALRTFDNVELNEASLIKNGYLKYETPMGTLYHKPVLEVDNG